MNQQLGVLSQAGKQFGGLAKSAVKRVVREPMEVLKTAVGVKSAQREGGESKNEAMQALEQALTGQQQQMQMKAQDDSGKAPVGFKTQADFNQYVEKSSHKDSMEIEMIRRRLAQEWGVERGMEQARQEYKQKEEQREKIEEQKKEQKEMMELEQKKVENAQVISAKNMASAEKRIMMG